MALPGSSFFQSFNFSKLFVYFDFPFVVVADFLNFQAAEPRDAVGGYAVVMEEIPMAFIFGDAVMRGPTHNGF